MINNKNPGVGKITNVANSQKDNLTPLSFINSTVLSRQAAVDDTAATSIENYYRMVKAIRTSGIWLVGWTIFSAIDGNISWAFALAIVSLMSFYFSDVAAMFLVFAGVLLWATVWNLFLSGDPMWIVMGIVQVVFTVLAIRDYRKYRNTKALYASTINDQDTSSLPHRESRMAWLALCLGSVILIGLVSFIPIGIAMNYVNTNAFDELVGTLLMVIIELGALGIPVGIAALVSGYQPKAAAAIGTGLGVLSGLLSIGMVILESMV